MKSLKLGLCLVAVALSLPLCALTSANYSHTIRITVAGYSGAASVADFPALVRLSTAIAGFSYDDFKLADGGDLRFVDAQGNLLASEVDTWNPDGESLVWVKLPTLAAGTQIIAYYGNETPDELPGDSLWSGYLGVWHFNSISSAGVTPDATANALDLTAKNTSLATVRDGVFGSSLVSAWAWGTKTGGFKTADYRKTFSSDVFTVSGWFYHNLNVNDFAEYLFTAKSGTDAKDGFGMRMLGKNNQSARVFGATENVYVSVPMPNVSNAWTKVTVVYDGETATAYTNGFVSASGTIKASTQTWKGLGVGNLPANDTGAWRGSLDEVRFTPAAQGADRVRAEWESETKADFFSYAAVQRVADSIFLSQPHVTAADGALVVSATVTHGAGTVSIAYGPAHPFATTNLIAASASAPNTYTLTLQGLAADTCYSFSLVGESAQGVWTEMPGASAFLNGDVSLAKTRDASEANAAVPATIVVSRPSGDAATCADLVVNYTVGGTAVAGTHYRALPGSVTIPAGASSATIEIYPLIAQDGDHDVVVTLANGAYFADAGASSATVTLAGITYLAGYNTWTGEAGDGLASSAANWSDGLPTAQSQVYLDGRFSSADLTWDAGVNGLPATVASWTQTADYAGTVTFTTGYDGANAQFAIAGDAVVNGGAWTHPTNMVNETQTSRINISVGGSFTLGAAAKIDAKGRGFANGKCRKGSATACHASSPTGDPSQVYGSVREPIDVGCGGRSDTFSCGGGAVRLVVAGAAVIDGAIDVRSSTQRPASEKNNGAGGSVFITAASLSGAGTVDASAYASDGSESCQLEGASGGRIALVATAGEVTIPLANLKANGATGGSVKGSAATGGGGTIYVKNATDANGALLVGTTGGNAWSYVKRYPTVKSATLVPPGETWTFDRLYLRGQGILSVPSGATLVLPNGFASVSNTDTSDKNYSCGILYAGGTIQVPETTDHVISGSWLFDAVEPFSFTGNVCLKGNAGFGCLYLTQPTVTNTLPCQVSVTGDLTVEPTGVLYGKNRGQRNVTSGHVAATHGGITGYETDLSKVYDSVFHPRYSGACGQGAGGTGRDQAAQNVGGGALKLTVGGALTLNSKADFGGSSGSWEHNSGAGGGVDIVAGSLSGSGSISVDGAKSQSGTTVAGGGGRVAIKLTDKDATFTDQWKSNITALGGKKGTDKGKDASAGTVYLQDGSQADGAGTIVIANNDLTAIEVPTILPGAGWGADAADAFKSASLCVEKAGILQLSENLTLNGASVAAATNGKIDLNGKRLKLASLVVDGAKVASGTYAAGDAALGGAFVDTSSDASGSVVIGGNKGFILLIR